MTAALIDQIGGEEALIQLVNEFYDLMETLPEAAQIQRLHFRGHGLDHTRVEQVNFMSGFMGGRQYYLEKHGHMDVREIHAHVPIRQEDAEVWLATWDKALASCGHEGPHIEKLRATVRRVAHMLINTVPDWRKGEAL
ncbi:MAG: group II truncated hemoglobin [Rhodobacteraceae bacterium]|nr:group II truncated hemoglobin [Paracoccaceae bacterium]